MWLWWIDFMLAAGAAVVVVFVIVLNARDEYGLNFRSWLGAPNRISERPPRERSLKIESARELQRIWLQQDRNTYLAKLRG